MDTGRMMGSVFSKANSILSDFLVCREPALFYSVFQLL